MPEKLKRHSTGIILLYLESELLYPSIINYQDFSVHKYIMLRVIKENGDIYEYGRQPYILYQCKPREFGPDGVDDGVSTARDE